jgi:hypothetical protein
VDARRVYRLVAGALILAALATLPRGSALAQAPNCPANSTQLALPYGTYPGSSVVCATADNQQTVNDPFYPCGSAVETTPGIAIGFSPMLFMPPLTMAFPSGHAGVAFALSIDYALPWPAHAVPRVQVTSYSSGGMMLGQINMEDPFRIDHVAGDKYIYYYVNSANLGCLVPGCQPYVPMMMGGYIRLDVTNYTSTGVDRYGFSSVRIVDSGQVPPDMCGGIPYPVPPPPTPTPQGTPTPTNTPTHTPTGVWDTPTPTNTSPAITLTPTLWPTSPGITTTPRPSSTPVALATIPVHMPTTLPQPTWPGLNLPAVSFPLPEIAAPTPVNVQVPQWVVPFFAPLEFPVPTAGAPITPPFGYTWTLPAIGTPVAAISVPVALTLTVGLTPNPTLAAATGVISGTLVEWQIAATRWYTVTSSGDFLASDTGIGSTVETLSTFVENLSLPIRYLKSLQDWFPNIWPFIVFLLISFAWINFVIMAKFLTHNGTKILEIIRRLIELIPGF